MLPSSTTMELEKSKNNDSSKIPAEFSQPNLNDTDPYSDSEQK